jgi:hypothetical protein
MKSLVYLIAIITILGSALAIFDSKEQVEMRDWDNDKIPLTFNFYLEGVFTKELFYGLKGKPQKHKIEMIAFQTQMKQLRVVSIDDDEGVYDNYFKASPFEVLKIVKLIKEENANSDDLDELMGNSYLKTIKIYSA